MAAKSIESISPPRAKSKRNSQAAVGSCKSFGIARKN